MPPKRARTHFVCAACGEASARWFGRCPSCDAWNTLVEEAAPTTKGTRAPAGKAAAHPIPVTEAHAEDATRRPVGENEIDRVLGGGVVPGSVILLGGEPGVGKSTLLLQLASGYAKSFGNVLYVSGEESSRQVALRAARLGAADPRLLLLSETDVLAVAGALEREKPSLVIIDSIQTMSHPDLESSPGSVGQVRECGHLLGRVAKETGIPLVLVGHVNKEGALAGPKVLEHLVDVVLSFEGERTTPFRTLRAVKNRFGSTHEVGIFQMGGDGLRPVPNPSELFLAERPGGSPGSVVIAAHEGSRPMLIEAQALASPSPFGGSPRRQVAGADPARVAIILAVLEKRLGMKLVTHDVYVNVPGGVRVSEPACDLGIAVAVASSYRSSPLDAGTVVFGEVGLTGEVRSVSHAALRIGEAARLGFRRAIVPAGTAAAGREAERAGIEVIGVESVEGAIAQAVGGGKASGREVRM